MCGNLVVIDAVGGVSCSFDLPSFFGVFVIVMMNKKNVQVLARYNFEKIVTDDGELIM